MKEKALVIFTRNPKLGKVKTRLAKVIGDKEALEVYLFLLKHTAKIAKKVNADKIVYYSEKLQVNDLWDNSIFQKKNQKGDDLGARMQQAFQDSFKANYQKVVLIGSDMYDISETHIEEAFKQLNTHDVVLGPAEDGGYYLLGLKKIIPEIFQNKKWGTNTVLRDTLQNLETVNVALLKELNDVDVYADIEEHPAFKEFLK